MITPLIFTGYPRWASIRSRLLTCSTVVNSGIFSPWFSWLRKIFRQNAWLKTNWARPRGNKVYPPINLALPGRWPEDYRIPDLVLLTPDRFHIDRNEYFEGGPTVVVEIRSPGDESYEKLSFYAQLEIPEVWIIDRDTRRPEVFRLSDAGYQSVAVDGDGWIISGVTAIGMRAEHGKLAITLVDDPASLRFLPEE